jgi:hypothetical protein
MARIANLERIGDEIDRQKNLIRAAARKLPARHPLRAKLVLAIEVLDDVRTRVHAQCRTWKVPLLPDETSNLKLKRRG